jgi:hypothetical protein
MARDPRSTLDALDRLAAQEAAFLGREFLAPVVRGGEVRVRIAGVVCRMRVSPEDFTGWGVYRAASLSAAELVRPARLAERQRYLDLFPRVRLIALRVAEGHCLAMAAQRGDRRIRLTHPADVHLAEDVQPFDTLLCRYDGARFWFDALDPARDPGHAAYLRESLPRMLPPDELARPGLSAEERLAYAMHYEARLAEERAADEARREALRDRTEERLRAALAHAGADLADYRELADAYQVRYHVGGEEHVSVVGKDDLTVHSAGICLSGEDAQFDLESLVGVLRESQGG